MPIIVNLVYDKWEGGERLRKRREEYGLLFCKGLLQCLT
jgi:hypothetical protein